MRPPRVARGLLARLAPPADRPWLIDDLDEEFRERCSTQPLRTARRWYRVQVLTSAAPLLGRRFGLLRSRHGGSRTMTLDSLVQDVRFAFRTFARRPGFTAVAVVTIGLGVGANTAIFSLVDAVLLEAVPGMGETRGLVEIGREVDGSLHDVPWPVYEELAARTAGVEALAGFDLEPVAVDDGTDPRATLSMSVTASYFDLLHLRPGRGRFFAPNEAAPPSSARVVIVSDAFWRARLGSDPGAVGRVVRVNGQPMTVVGVGPAGFRGHQLVPADVFLPLGASVPGVGPGEGRVSAVEILARTAPGAALETVAASASEIGERVLRQGGVASERATFRVRVSPWGPIPAVGRGAVSAFMGVLMLAVGLVLAVACVNVAGMVLSRASERRGEIAVRRALGAGRHRIARQLVTESLLLFLGGGASGVLLASGLTRLLARFEPPLPPGFELPLDPGVNGRVLAFALGLTTLTAVVFNVAPAWRTARRDVASGLAGGRVRDDGRQGTRLRSGLVAGQAAASLVLLVTAGLFLRSHAAMRTTDFGWDASGVIAAELDLSLSGLPEAEGRAALATILERAAALPGVRSAALAAKLPFAGRSSFGDVHVADVEPPPGRTGFAASLNRVSPGYFETLGITLLEGRGFGPAEVPGAERVAIVNRTMAERLWRDGRALGQRFWLGSVGSEEDFMVVGVAENAAVGAPGEAPEPFYYVPAAQWYNARMVLLVRTHPEASAEVASALRSTIRRSVPALPVDGILPLEERLALHFLPQRLAAWVTGSVGLLGLLLSAVGIYGLTAFAVGHRTREIGVRLALGARPADVRTGVVRQAMKAPLAGAVLGLALGVGVAQAASRFLVGVRPGDPWAWGVAVAALLAAALVAALVPALGAARLAPAVTLRAE